MRLGKHVRRGGLWVLSSNFDCCRGSNCGPRELGERGLMYVRALQLKIISHSFLDSLFAENVTCGMKFIMSYKEQHLMQITSANLK